MKNIMHYNTNVFKLLLLLLIGATPYAASSTSGKQLLFATAHFGIVSQANSMRIEALTKPELEKTARQWQGTAAMARLLQELLTYDRTVDNALVSGSWALYDALTIASIVFGNNDSDDEQDAAPLAPVQRSKELRALTCYLLPLIEACTQGDRGRRHTAYAVAQTGEQLPDELAYWRWVHLCQGLYALARAGQEGLMTGSLVEQGVWATAGTASVGALAKQAWTEKSTQNIIRGLVTLSDADEAFIQNLKPFQIAAPDVAANLARVEALLTKQSDAKKTLAGIKFIKDAERTKYNEVLGKRIGKLDQAKRILQIKKPRRQIQDDADNEPICPCPEADLVKVRQVGYDNRHIKNSPEGFDCPICIQKRDYLIAHIQHGAQPAADLDFQHGVCATCVAEFIRSRHQNLNQCPLCRANSKEYRRFGY